MNGVVSLPCLTDSVNLHNNVKGEISKANSNTNLGETPVSLGTEGSALRDTRSNLLFGLKQDRAENSKSHCIHGRIPD